MSRTPMDLDLQGYPIVCRVGLFWTRTSISDIVQRRLFEHLSYYTNDILRTVIVPLNRQQYPVSERAVDWFVTNFAVSNGVTLLDTGDNKPPFNVDSDYQSMLSHWRKESFDIFRRHEHIYFEWEGQVEYTTLGQLNFVRWALENGVLAYCITIKEEIAADMKSKALPKARNPKKLKGVRPEDAQPDEEQQPGNKKKRRQLSKPSNRPCQVYCKSITLDLFGSHTVND